MAKIFWCDFDNDFEMANNGDVRVMTNTDAIFNSLTNLFETIQGSRRMLPDFASVIHFLLFEPVDRITAGRIADALIMAILRWEKRIVVNGLDIVALTDSNQYRVTLNFSIVEDNSDEAVQVFSTILRAR